jgi:hypothetical protein
MCHSDVQLVDGYFRNYADMPTPITLGHEITGLVHEVGSIVPKLSGFREGDHVVVVPEWGDDTADLRTAGAAPSGEFLSSWIGGFPSGLKRAWMPDDTIDMTDAMRTKLEPCGDVGSESDSPEFLNLNSRSAGSLLRFATSHCCFGDDLNAPARLRWRAFAAVGSDIAWSGWQRLENKREH